jgi:hypothetical protein
MKSLVLRRIVTCAALLVGLLLAAPGSASATVRGGCQVTAQSTSGGPINLTTEAVWHVKSTDRIGGSGTAPTPQTHADVRATALGFKVPIGGGPADPTSEASSDTFEMSTFAILGRVFLISGESTGPGGGCNGEVLVIIDDVNPLTTVLGGGSLIAILIGIALLGWGLRNPVGLGHRLGGVTGLALIGIGVSVLLQQFASGATDASPLARSSAWVQSVVSPAAMSLDTGFLARMGILGLLILVLLPFPSQLFNSTLEQNYEDIRGGIKRIPIVGRAIRPSSDLASERGRGAWWRRVLVIAFVLVSGVLYGLLDPSFGLTETSAVTYAGIVLGLVIVTWLANLPNRWIHGTLTRDRGRLWTIPSTLVVAAFCVLISRLVGFMPGYLYGLVFGYVFAMKVEPQQDARGGAAGAWWLLALAGVAWITLGAVRTQGVDGTIPGTIAEAILAALVVSGIEGVVFAMLPLRFLPGEAVFKHQRVRWFVLYGLGLAGFVYILLNPASGYVPSEGSASFIVALALFVGFGISSILFWGYFRFRRKPAAA